MQCGKPWGDELEDLSVDNWDFLEDRRFTNIIAMAGGVKNIQNVSLELNTMINNYKRISILKEIDSSISFNSLLCLHQVSLLRKSLEGRNINSVIEVGGGLGNFSRIFRQFLNDVSYTIYDLPVMRKFSEKFLKASGLKQEYINSNDWNDRRKAVSGRKYDLFISNICLSEIPDKRRSEIIGDLFPICQHAFVIDYSRDDFGNMISGIFNLYFDEVHIVPYVESMWKDHKVYFGSKL